MISSYSWQLAVIDIAYLPGNERLSNYNYIIYIIDILIVFFSFFFLIEGNVLCTKKAQRNK